MTTLKLRRGVAMGYITVNGKEIKTTNSARLANPRDWSEAVAKGLAKVHGVEELTDRHFAVINCLRSLNGQSSDMFAVADALKKIVTWKEFKNLFHRGLSQALVISGCEIP
jgi:dissimilatory sulfite reductase related protein